MKRTACLASIVALASFAAGCGSGGPSGPTASGSTAAAVTSAPSFDVALVGPASPVQVGQRVDVRLTGDRLAGLQGAGLDLTYDPALLELQGVSDGGLMPAAASGGGLVGGAPGRVTIAVAAEGTSAGASGTGDLLIVHFVARAAGTTRVQPGEVVLEDALGREGHSTRLSPVQVTLR